MLAPSVRPSAREAYNLFRRRSEPETICAVPEDRAVPPFLSGDDWEYKGKSAGGPMGAFDLHAARASVRFNGFYLYHAYGQRGSGALRA
jgi:hypothetical protein